MKSYTSRQDFTKALNDEIDWFKKYLSDSYSNLDLYLKSKIEVGDFVFLKSCLDKGIVQEFSLELRNPNQKISDRIIKVSILTLKGTLKTSLDDIVIYSDAARLLYNKQVVVNQETPKKANDEIPF